MQPSSNTSVKSGKVVLNLSPSALSYHRLRRASQFNSSVELLRDDTGETADGKSILSVLLLAASRGTSLIIKAEGDDEERAIDALVELVEQKFGEELSDGVF